MEGFIKLYRQFKAWEWYKDGNTMRVFIHLLLSANHKPGRWKGIEIARGEYISGRKALAEALDMTENEIRTAIGHLKTTKEITTIATSSYTIFNLTNYDLYQGDTTNETTNQPPSDNQQTTTNKNNNNNNNEKKSRNTRQKKGKKIEKEVAEKFEVYKNVTLTKDQEEKLKALYGKLYTKALEKLSAHKCSKGVSYVSDYDTMHRGGWVFDAIQEKNPSLGTVVIPIVQPKEEQTDTDKERNRKEKEELAELQKYFEGLSPEVKKILDAGARFALQGAKGIMKQGTGKGWEDFVTGKRRSLTRIYRSTGELPITEAPPAEDDTTT